MMDTAAFIHAGGKDLPGIVDREGARKQFDRGNMLLVFLFNNSIQVDHMTIMPPNNCSSRGSRRRRLSWVEDCNGTAAGPRDRIGIDRFADSAPCII